MFLLLRIIEIITTEQSAIGVAIKSPIIGDNPNQEKTVGIKNNKGINKSTCLVSASITDATSFPVTWSRVILV